MTGPRPTRRRWLVGLGAATTGALAGCSATMPGAVGDASTPTPPSHARLERTRTFVAPAVSLALPEAVPRVADPEDAGLVVLPATTDVAPATALDWLVAGRAVALVGAASEPTFHRWTDSDAYYDAFEPPHGRSDSTPEPDLLVAFAVGRQFVATHRYSWGHTDGPSDAELLEALETALRDEATRTPPG